MNAEAKENGYFIDGMPNDEYHKPATGLSTSGIKDFMVDPAQYLWSRTAAKDETKLSALDFGTDFHSYFLEPELFAERYQVLPKFDRRNRGEKQAELDLIDEWKKSGIIPVTNEDMAKLKAMRESALAHPTVAAIMDMQGVAERSYFWTDPKTEVACKCRPDWLVLDVEDMRPAFIPDDCQTLVMDVKTIASVDRIQNQIENLKYYVQDAFYTRGISHVTQTNVCFAFAFVSTSLSLGRYPVRVVILDETAKFDGKQDVSAALDDYAAMLASEDENNWQTAITMDRPSWATREDDLLLGEYQ